MSCNNNCFMVGKEKYRDINSLLNKKINEKKVLIAVHRGSPGGNIIENTIPAYHNSLRLGGDMFEMDVIKSTDGILYTFHDGTERRNLKEEDNIKTMSSEKIDSLFYYNSIGAPSEFKVERFEDVVKEFNKGELYNIDRAWDIFPEVFEALNKYDYAIGQALFKSPVKKEILEFLEKNEKKYMYMPIVYSLEEIEEVLSYENINLVGLEIIAKDTECDLFNDDVLDRLKSKGLFLWVNAITLDKEIVLYGKLDDNISVIEGPENGWGKLFEKKIDIIQTDWPSLLKEYRDKYFNK
ncbi:glycerophosphodiester phosphodiesterase family protein [Clostridium sp. NSJ-6]|uniref:Glycerophosphodiester phosphodiesterase family protein n=1 Tax=Clostridium hominis TaxID=2763036 RepID=A0ABR7DCV8_9CLOT|nr:glycerophosphodiester phosphodiesterase family protein [Clostridium hominis]MBC5629224.1 glycerophosphodiester phosphodiesterase family protein [Clostridium hominis]MDU2671718.1 glycerophosphodiester phosphodiesterase family protein [Clostridium sp.]